MVKDGVYPGLMQTPSKSKLLRVYCAIRHTSRGTKYTYTGQFEDGTVRKIRESANAYVSVAQIRYAARPAQDHWLARPEREEFCFSSKPTVKLAKWQTPEGSELTTVRVGLDTAAEGV
jgi:hypothetical protein